MTATARGPRSFVRDIVGLVWLAAAVVVALVHRSLPEATWLMVHLVALGALSHAILVWSAHFAQALLRTVPRPHDRRDADLRLWLHTVGAASVFVGVPTATWPLVVAGATLVTIAVAWHATALVRDLRRALPGRFRVTLRYYLAAAACLPVGAAFGATLAFGLDDEWHARFLVAHSMVNLLGWVGLTVTGTLVTLWPTVLRTRMDDRADRLARQALPALAAASVVVPAGGLLGWRWLSVAGLVLYLAGVAWWGRALLRPLRAKPPRSFAAASVGAGLVWFVVAVVATAATLATSPTPQAIADAYPTLAGVFVAGFAVQLLTGALSYLVPAVMGGGPSVVRAGNAWLDRGATFRLVTINAGLALFWLPVPSWVKVSVSALVLGSMASFLVLMVMAVRAIAAARRDAEAGTPAPTASATPPAPAASAPAPPTAPPAPDASPVWTSGQLVAALTALALAVTVGVGIDPAAAGLATTGAGPTASVTATGRTTRVTVTAVGMAFSPSSIEVPRGDRLVIELVNADPTTTHDLAVGDVRTPRLAPGARAELDVGVVGASTQGWCTVVGHRQMGMVLAITVIGDAASTADPAPTTSNHGGHTDATAPSAPNAHPATPTPLTRTVDPVLPPLTDEKVRRVTLTVTEVPLEVAPGVWQRRWTYNGGAVGPTLHGRVGDVFEVTLVNDGTIGHSIDFHAGALAPDQPMRTIPPGESLVYRFTATRAGIWMYHCSTHPMSAHIAAGMAGAVVIEPEGLPAVDRSYLLVQSEVYLATASSTPDAATEVDADAVNAEAADRVVFNGIANQYDTAPFAARVGERVRFWVLNVGPNRSSSFHIVGGQFDTVYHEGGYRLRDGRDPFGTTNGGSQALDLAPAQGGFVELALPEAGHYPVVSHLMVDAERGAHGIVDVTG